MLRTKRLKHPAAYKAGDVSKRNVFLSVISGILLGLSFPNAGLGILAWVAFVPFFFVLENCSAWNAFRMGFIAGLAFWASTVYWLVNVTLIGTALLIVYLAVYFGLFGLGTFYLGLLASSQKKNKSAQAVKFFAVALLWMALEYSRSYLLTGFPWALVLVFHE